MIYVKYKSVATHNFDFNTGEEKYKEGHKAKYCLEQAKFLYNILYVFTQKYFSITLT